jgi:hypothetical protein
MIHLLKGCDNGSNSRFCLMIHLLKGCDNGSNCRFCLMIHLLKGCDNGSNCRFCLMIHLLKGCDNGSNCRFCLMIHLLKGCDNGSNCRFCLYLSHHLGYDFWNKLFSRCLILSRSIVFRDYHLDYLTRCHLNRELVLRHNPIPTLYLICICDI